MQGVQATTPELFTPIRACLLYYAAATRIILEMAQIFPGESGNSLLFPMQLYLAILLIATIN